MDIVGNTYDDFSQRVIRTLTFANPDRAPRDLWALAGVGMLRKDELEAMRERFPGDMTGRR